MARDDFTKGYESTDPADADAPGDMGAPYCPPGGMAAAVKKRWDGVPYAYPYGKAKDGGGGGGQ